MGQRPNIRNNLNFTPEFPFKPVAKKVLESGVSHAGERLGKKISEKSGDLIMKRLANIRKGDTRQKAIEQQGESTDMILNRLISGSGIKRRRSPLINNIIENNILQNYGM